MRSLGPGQRNWANSCRTAASRTLNTPVSRCWVGASEPNRHPRTRKLAATAPTTNGPIHRTGVPADTSSGRAVRPSVDTIDRYTHFDGQSRPDRLRLDDRTVRPGTTTTTTTTTRRPSGPSERTISAKSVTFRAPSPAAQREPAKPPSSGARPTSGGSANPIPHSAVFTTDTSTGARPSTTTTKACCDAAAGWAVPALVERARR